MARLRLTAAVVTGSQWSVRPGAVIRTGKHRFLRVVRSSIGAARLLPRTALTAFSNSSHLAYTLPKCRTSPPISRPPSATRPKARVAMNIRGYAKYLTPEAVDTLRASFHGILRASPGTRSPPRPRGFGPHVDVRYSVRDSRFVVRSKWRRTDGEWRLSTRNVSGEKAKRAPASSLASLLPPGPPHAPAPLSHNQAQKSTSVTDFHSNLVENRR